MSIEQKYQLYKLYNLFTFGGRFLRLTGLKQRWTEAQDQLEVLMLEERGISFGFGC